VADEPVSMLDVSIRAGVLNLMLDLRDKYHIPYLFITHDIAVARYVSDRLAVMYLGRVVEIAETDEVIFSPKHPYTRALLSAVPVPDPEHKHGRISIKGEIPSATNIPLGCRFRTRCPFAFKDCGYEGKDLSAFLLDKEKVSAPEHPMSKHIEQVEPHEFALLIKLRPEGDESKVKSFIESKINELKDSMPMFQAVVNVETGREALSALFAQKSKKNAKIMARLTKSAGGIVVVRFAQIDEPPLIDVGKGHRVACYLFKQTS
jgi:oligopeptide/dipeptide ABC transporter ATP-binding protein